MPERLVPRPDRAALAAPWKDPGSFATTLLIAFVDLMGAPGAPDEDEEPLGWAPETIRLELADHLGFQPEPILFDRLMAAIQVATGDAFYDECAAFVAECLGGDAATCEG